MKHNIEVAALSIDDTMAYLGNVSRRKIEQLIEHGSLKSRKLGRRRIVMKRSVDQYLESLIDDIAA